MRRKISIFGTLILATLAQAGSRTAEWQLPPDSARFKPGPGAELATGQCLICHSADYISTQPPLDRAGWNAIVLKMKDKYGAPILTNTVDKLASYLAATYGKEKE